ncbi:MAG: hypothetical protein DMD36_17420 [Gemmatimonadetes bacterium]|nr:MAG: hypothetical protein DMD36_17420 [Gemmatimonadota bacterium]
MVHRCQICGEEHGTHDAAWKHVRYVHPEIPRRDINTKIEEVVRSPDGTEIINKPGQGGEHGQESRQSRARQPLFQIALPGLFIAMVLLVVLLMASGGGTEMTPLLLVMLALPWSGLFGAVQAGGGSAFIDREVPGLLINAGLLFAVGLWIDSKLPPRDTA